MHTCLVQRATENGGGCPLADGAVGAEHGDPGARDAEDAAIEHMQVGFRLGSAHVDDLDVVDRGGRGELRVVVQELVESVDDAETATHRIEQHRAFVCGEQTTGRGDTHDEQFEGDARRGQGVIEIANAQDAVRSAVQHLSGVPSSLRRVDHRDDLVALTVSHEAVRRFAVVRAEVGVAVDDRSRPTADDGRRCTVDDR